MTTITTANPATGKQLDHYDVLDGRGIEDALQRASDAQDAWRTVPVADRVAPLRRLAELLESEAEAHARLISTEMGKPVAEALAEVAKCARTCRYYAEHAEDFLSPIAVQTEATDSFVSYEPLGVILAVMPWNFPYWQVIRFAAPALAAGNGALLKHASNVAGCAVELQSLMERAGFPAGLFENLPVQHRDVSGIIADPRVAAVTLTGSEAAGVSVAEAAGRALKKTVLELGGSDPFVVLADAEVSDVVPAAVRARFGNAGQSCLCAKRFVVEDGVAEEFERLSGEHVAALAIGDPFEEGTQIGPLAKRSFVDDIDRQVRESVAMGARVVTGGYRIDRPGNYYAPTVLADVTPDMPVFREETFGPVMAIVRAADVEQAVELANDTQYGLGASVWTSDTERGLRVGQRIRSGALFINAITSSDPRMPFGGIKLSGYGRELGREGMLEFVNCRTVWAA